MKQESDWFMHITAKFKLYEIGRQKIKARHTQHRYMQTVNIYSHTHTSNLSEWWWVGGWVVLGLNAKNNNAASTTAAST